MRNWSKFWNAHAISWSFAIWMEFLNLFTFFDCWMNFVHSFRFVRLRSYFLYAEIYSFFFTSVSPLRRKYIVEMKSNRCYIWHLTPFSWCAFDSSVDSSQMKPRNFTNGSWHHTKVLNLTLLTTTITETKTTTTTTTEMMLLLTLQCVKHFTEKWWKSILGSMLWGKCKTCLSVPRINSERMAETLHTSHWNASVALLNVFTFLLYILWMNVRNSSRHHFHYLLWLFQQLNLDWRRTTNLKTVSK